MLSLSTNTKEAIKVGLAMTIAYYVALRFSWMSSTWAAIAVAFISLPTAGQSINKGMLRIGGTLLAFVAGLFFLGLFPQDRWYFLLAFSPYLAFVTYKMTGKDGQYFWFCAAFVSMMITMAGPGKGNAFDFAAYRTMETIVGVVIWTLIAVFLWPRSNQKKLVATGRELFEAMGQLLDGYRAALLEHGTGKGLQDARVRAGNLAGELEQTIAAAASESHEIHEVRHLWKRLHGLSVGLLDVMDRLQPGLEDLQHIDFETDAGEVKTFFSLLNSRLREAQAMLGGQPPGDLREAMPASLGSPRLDGLNHFQRAAIEVTRTELENLDPLTRAQVNCVRDLEGYQAGKESPALAPCSQAIAVPFGPPPLDPDRVRATLMVIASMWTASLIWIYFNPPGHAAWYQFVPSLALVAAQYPHVRFKLLKPMAYAYVVTLALYVFLMPQLSSFSQLGPLIFLITFGAAYYFTGLARVAIYLGMFNMLGISNQQTYDFAAQANAFLFTMMGIMLVVALTYITRTPRPKQTFISMLRRFFRACEFLISEVDDSAGASSLLQRMKRAYYLQELRMLPTKLGVWGKQIDPVRLDEIVSRIQNFAQRTAGLLAMRPTQQARLVVKELGNEERAWRLMLERGLKDWSERPDVESAVELRERLSARLAGLNARIEQILNRPGRQQLTQEESRNFYRLLGRFRGLTQAAIAYAESTGSVDWKEWREERF